MTRDSKGKSNEIIANKLKSARYQQKTFKSVISPNRSYSFPPLDNDGQIITEDVDKANA